MATPTREKWIATVAKKLRSYKAPGNPVEYAEALYCTYVEEDGEMWADDPLGALAEDMSYWGD